MSGRELVILLLGLAIVAVVLRGLYVALNARRGQIKLAIDKNIPQNVDLEALEMAELPGGGARVVTRSLEEVNRQNSALDKAESKAKRIRLADEEDDEQIPVLMDAVELSEPAPQTPKPEAPAPTPSQDYSAADDSRAESVDEEEFPAPQMPLPEDLPEELEESDGEEFSSYEDQTPAIGDDWEEVEAEEEEEVAAAEQAEAEGSELSSFSPELGVDDEDPDDVLFDYDDEDEDSSAEVARNAEDAMRAVAPDYEDEQETDEVYEASEDSADAPNNDSYEDNEEVDLEADFEAEDEDGVVDDEDEHEPFDADRDIDEFSMTAGERIGGNPPAIGEARQTGLFDEHEDDPAESTSKPKKGRSLFGMFGRKQQQGQGLDETAEQPVQPVDESQLEDFADAEDSDWAAEAEATSTNMEEPAALHEPEVVDELDQKRAASAEQEAEESEPQSGEFEQSEVLVLNVTAKDGRVFAGDDLLHILITSGLKFGDMNIFHKRLSKDNQGSVIFSVANMLNPGTFDLNKMDEFTTLGISFFLALPTPINNLDAFEQMLSVAQDIRDNLGGDLKDDHRNGMTAQTVEHYRQRIRDFELRRLKAVAARG